VRLIRTETGVQRAARVLQDNHYGWFARVARGVYQLTPAGEAALRAFADVVADLSGPPETAPGPSGRNGARGR